MKTPKFAITKQEVFNACTPDVFDFGNEWLYKLCSDYPRHTDESHSIAKVWLIGRAYSAAIERKSAPEGADELYRNQIGPAMRKSRLDILISELPDGRSPIEERFSFGVEVHAELMRIWSTAGATGKRSLASKYLHFHCPNVFPLLDSRALAGIKKVTPDARRVPKLDASSGDTIYRSFCARSAWLIREIRQQFRARLSLRQIDKLLLAIGRK